MANKTKVKLTGLFKWKDALYKELTKEQTNRLIAYAKERIISIGASIEGYNSKNHMDRTGNLLDSLCWGVLFNGKMKGSGFFRPATAIENSNLHEWSNPKGESINGHQRAKNFIQTYKSSSDGWEVFFAVLAPYWGYWEAGHINVKSGQIQRWQVMAQQFDVVSQDLSPMKVTFHNYVP